MKVPTVMFGGFSLLNLIARDALSPFQEQFFRAGHAHAGVLLILAQPRGSANRHSPPGGDGPSGSAGYAASHGADPYTCTVAHARPAFGRADRRPEAAPSAPNPPELGGPVSRVVDGDTADVQIEGVTTRIRIIGIDTPETVAPGQPVDCFGPEASARARELLEGQTVTLEPDPTQDQIDAFGRLLVYVTLPDGRGHSLPRSWR